MGAKFKIATTVLGDRRVGQIVENPGLNADETIKEMKLDTSAFSFIIEGTTGTLRITVITTGEEEGVIVLGEETQLNGFEIEMHEGDKISYRVPETGVEGEIDPVNITSSKSRITIFASALSELADDPANNGRDIVFTVKIGNKKVVKLSLSIPNTSAAISPVWTSRRLRSSSSLTRRTTATVHMDMPNGKSLEIDMIDGNTLTLLSPNSLKLHLQANTSTEPDGTWKMGYPICVVVRKGDGTELKKQIAVV